MPEVCEVALTAQYLLTKLKGRYITALKVVGGKYMRLPLPGLDLISQNSLPLEIINIHTKGKFMWFELLGNDQRLFIFNHFGMTGEWSFKKDSNDRIILDIETDPNNVINKKYKLHFADQRNFGKFEISDDEKRLQEKIQSLAPDILKTNFTSDQFLSWIKKYIEKSNKRSKVPIVKVLMRQNIDDGICSGIGNYLSSEILYRAKISPFRQIGSLSEDEIKVLAFTIKRVVKLCYISNITGYMTKLSHFVEKHKEKVDSGIFPNYHPDIKLESGETFKFLVYRRKEDDFGNPVKVDVIIKPRSTYWVPNVQI